MILDYIKMLSELLNVHVVVFYTFSQCTYMSLRSIMRSLIVEA